MVKKRIVTHSQTEKLLTFAGLALIAVGCIATAFSAYTNQRFIHGSFFAFVYYFSYLLLLAGGFAVGYLLVWGSGKQKTSDRMFSGVAYAFLAMALYFLLDLVRFAIQHWLDMLPFPWEGIIFQGSPLIALIVTALVAFMTQYRAKQADLSIAAKWTFSVSFITVQAYYLVTILPSLMTNAAVGDPYITPLWLMVGSSLVNPLFVLLVAYLLLGRVKTASQRLFYSTVVGGFSYFLLLVLWGFRTDPTVGATNMFEAVTVSVTLLATGFLLWKLYRATR